MLKETTVHFGLLPAAIASTLLLLFAERFFMLPAPVHPVALTFLCAAMIIWHRTEKERQAADERQLLQRNRELSILNALLSSLNQGEKLEKVLEETLQTIMELVGSKAGAVHLLGDGTVPPTAYVSREVPQQFRSKLTACIAQGMEGRSCVTVCGFEDPQAYCRLTASAVAEGWQRLCAIPLTAQNRLVGVMHLMHVERRAYSAEEIRFLSTVGGQMGNAMEHARLFAELDWKSAELLRSHRLLERSSLQLFQSEVKLKQNLALVEQANADLKRLSGMKNHFLGLVSHELNTPLTSILCGTDILLQGNKSPEETSVLQMVQDGGLRLKDLVGDLLKLVQLEAKESVLNSFPVHLSSRLELLRDQMRPVLDSRGQRLTLQGLEALPFFEGDWDYLERVFNELIENAIKFTPDGGEIVVSGRVVDRETLGQRKETLERFNDQFLPRCTDSCYLEVEVRDNGIGIPQEEQQGIFQVFYSVGDIKHHSSGKHKFQGKGAGLGLAIVKGMVEAHGGMVWVESGRGSSFFLVLPLEQQPSQPELF